MDELENVSMGCRCGVCKVGGIHFYTCPIHDWALGSVCESCKHEVKIKDDCEECGFTYERARRAELD